MPEAAIVALYGEYENELGQKHPRDEDMFNRPDQLAELFAEHDIAWHVAKVLEEPSGRRADGDIPRIVVARRPLYDSQGRLLDETVFEEGSLADYPALNDHWVANFQRRTLQPDGSFRRMAGGLGLPNERLWNARPIQEFGNNKDLMGAVLRAHGVELPTYDVSVADLERLTDEHPDKKVIYKPIDGSRAKGTRTFDAGTLRQALLAQTIAERGFLLQPFLDITEPFDGLVAADEHAEAKLSDVNARNDRVREIRMHVLAYTDESGMLQAVTYPTLKYSDPGNEIMQLPKYVALDPGSVSDEIRQTNEALARDVIMAAAAHSGERVTQCYGAFDWVHDAEGRSYVIDGNCRGPRLPVEAVMARLAFARVISDSAKRNLRIL